MIKLDLSPNVDHWEVDPKRIEEANRIFDALVSNEFDPGDKEKVKQKS